MICDNSLRGQMIEESIVIAIEVMTHSWSSPKHTLGMETSVDNTKKA